MVQDYTVRILSSELQGSRVASRGRLTARLSFPITMFFRQPSTPSPKHAQTPGSVRDAKDLFFFSFFSFLWLQLQSFPFARQRRQRASRWLAAERQLNGECVSRVPTCFGAKMAVWSVLSGIASLGRTWTGHFSIISEFTHRWSRRQLQFEVWRWWWWWVGVGGVDPFRMSVTVPPHGHWREKGSIASFVVSSYRLLDQSSGLCLHCVQIWKHAIQHGWVRPSKGSWTHKIVFASPGQRSRAHFSPAVQEECWLRTKSPHIEQNRLCKCWLTKHWKIPRNPPQITF